KIEDHPTLIPVGRRKQDLLHRSPPGASIAFSKTSAVTERVKALLEVVKARSRRRDSPPKDAKARARCPTSAACSEAASFSTRIAVRGAKRRAPQARAAMARTRQSGSCSPVS